MTVTAESKYSANIIILKTKLYVNLNYNGNDSFLYVNGAKHINLKRKIQK